MWDGIVRRYFNVALLAAMQIAIAAVAVAPLQAGERLNIVATTGMIADAAKQIGGQLVDVKALMGPGIDPHAYRQTRSDIVALSKADLVLWHGLYLEAQLEDFMKRLANRKTVVAVADSLPRDLLIAHDDYDGKFDPHIWMNPELWSRAILTVRDCLIEARPQHKAVLISGAERYLNEIARLNAYTKRILSSVPADRRVLVTAHDAFNYFGAHYGFEVVGIQGISTESEAGLQRISKLVAMLVKRRIGAVFVESSVSDRNIRALIEGAAAQGHTVAIGGELFSDAMGQPASYEGTYIGMIDHNTTTISRALGGQAPDKGMSGRLS